MDEPLKNKKKGVISKKKKKVNSCFEARFVSFSGRKLQKSCVYTGVDVFLFFFLEITPFFLFFCGPTWMITEVCTPLIKLICLTAAKSGTRPEKAGRMVTLIIAKF